MTKAEIFVDLLNEFVVAIVLNAIWRDQCNEEDIVAERKARKRLIDFVGLQYD